MIQRFEMSGRTVDDLTKEMDNLFLEWKFTSTQKSDDDYLDGSDGLGKKMKPEVFFGSVLNSSFLSIKFSA